MLFSKWRSFLSRIPTSTTLESLHLVSSTHSHDLRVLPLLSPTHFHDPRVLPLVSPTHSHDLRVLPLLPPDPLPRPSSPPSPAPRPTPTTLESIPLLFPTHSHDPRVPPYPVPSPGSGRGRPVSQLLPELNGRDPRWLEAGCGVHRAGGKPCRSEGKGLIGLGLRRRDRIPDW
ncbi:hypothetical protein ACRRTK_022379 [Alexandromys fortis]